MQEHFDKNIKTTFWVKFLFGETFYVKAVAKLIMWLLQSKSRTGTLPPLPFNMH